MRLEDFVWLFVLGSILGFLIEGIWCIIKSGKWENHSATVIGPFCIIYGIGTVVVYFLAHLFQDYNMIVQFFGYAVAGTLVEYLGSLFQEAVLGTRSWDYSKRFGNIHGRVTLLMTFFWGVLGVLFTFFAYPSIQNLFGRLYSSWNSILCMILCGFMIFDMLLSAAAILRWRNRMEGNAAQNTLARFLDSFFDDSKMKRIYQNMEFVMKEEMEFDLRK